MADPVLTISARQLLENMLEGVMVTDEHLVIQAVNQVFCDVTGYSRADAIGATPSLLKSNRHKAPFFKKMWASLLKNDSWQGEIWNRRQDGSQYIEYLTITAVRDATDRLTHYIGVFTDITKQKRAQETIRHMAYYDALTDLPNRFLFREQLRQALAQAQRHHELLGVLFFDLDRVKIINDTLGHDMGDRLLKGVAERLKSALRESDLVARLGGDEFMALLPGIRHPDEVRAITEKVLHVLRAPFQFDDHELYTTASIGMAIYPYDGLDADSLLKNADTAMYRAKRSGRNTFRAFDPQMKTEVIEQLALGNALRRALERKEFVVHYQPQIDIANGRIIGAEALVRWQHPELGLVPPASFIPWAEDSGLIVPIGEVVLRSACAQTQKWIDSLRVSLRVGVNLSVRQLRESNIVGTVAAALKETKLPPEALDLELTESLLMELNGPGMAIPHELRAMGVGFSIDDFGTGYSSLNYLKRLPVNTLKIDQSFVRDLTTDANDAAIASAVIGLGHGLNLQIVAEGVETESQLETLRDMKCDRVQGFLFSEPVPAEEFGRMLAENKRLPMGTLFDEPLNSPPLCHKRFLERFWKRSSRTSSRKLFTSLRISIFTFNWSPNSRNAWIHARPLASPPSARSFIFGKVD